MPVRSFHAWILGARCKVIIPVRPRLSEKLENEFRFFAFYATRHRSLWRHGAIPTAGPTL